MARTGSKGECTVAVRSLLDFLQKRHGRNNPFFAYNIHPCCKFRNENRFRFNPYISDLFRSIMNECEICFRRTDSFVVKVRITPSDYDSFFFSPNWCLKFIPNDSAPIRTKFSFRLNPFNPRIQTDWIPNDSETDFAFTRNHTESFSFRMSPKVASGMILSFTCKQFFIQLWAAVQSL